MAVQVVIALSGDCGHVFQSKATGNGLVIRVAVGAEDDLDQGGGGRACGVGLAQEPLVAPADVAAVRVGHVVAQRGAATAQGAAHRAGEALADMEDFDGDDGETAYKQPRDVVFMTAMPRNAMGKVLKYRLREMV